MTPSAQTLFEHSLQGFARTLWQLDHHIEAREGWTIAQPRTIDPGLESFVVVLRRTEDGARFTAPFISRDGGIRWTLDGDFQLVADAGYLHLVPNQSITAPLT